jgi:hypothetical protein
MKTLAYVLIGFVLIFCLTGIVSSKAEASQPGYVGEFCFNTTADGQSKGIFVFGVTDMGGGYYMLQSKAQATGDYGPWFFGSAQLVGNQYMLSLHWTHSDSPGPMRDVGGCQVVLDAATLNGTGWCVTTSYNKPPYNTFGNHYSEATFSLTTCP